MNRKQRRAREAQIRKDGNDDLAAQVAMFGKLPDECTACESPFDKKDKEMIPLKYDSVGFFDEGLAVVRIRGKDGFTDIHGNEYWDMTEDQAREQMKKR